MANVDTGNSKLDTGSLKLDAGQKDVPVGASCPVGPVVHRTAGEQKAETMQGTLTRRNFLKLGVSALGVLAALEVGGASLIFLQSRRTEGEFGGLVTAGPEDEFPSGSVTEFPNSRFFLVRAPEGGFLALHNRCPHLGCTVTWVPEANHFTCPCHASHFDFYGNFDNPPVPRPLDTFPVTFVDGKVIVDTSQLQQREEFSPDQLSYAGRDIDHEKV